MIMRIFEKAKNGYLRARMKVNAARWELARARDRIELRRAKELLAERNMQMEEPNPPFGSYKGQRKGLYATARTREENPILRFFGEEIGKQGTRQDRTTGNDTTRRSTAMLGALRDYVLGQRMFRALENLESTHNDPDEKMRLYRRMSKNLSKGIERAFGPNRFFPLAGKASEELDKTQRRTVSARASAMRRQPEGEAPESSPSIQTETYSRVRDEVTRRSIREARERAEKAAGEKKMKECYREAIRISKRLRGNKKPGEMSDQEFADAMKLLKSEKPEEKTAAMILIAARRSREMLDDLVAIAEDKDHLVKSFAALAICNLRDLESVKKLVELHLFKQEATNAAFKAVATGDPELTVEAVCQVMEEYKLRSQIHNDEAERVITGANNLLRATEEEAALRSVWRAWWWLGINEPQDIIGGAGSPLGNIPGAMFSSTLIGYPGITPTSAFFYRHSGPLPYIGDGDRVLRRKGDLRKGDTPRELIRRSMGALNPRRSGWPMPSNLRAVIAARKKEEFEKAVGKKFDDITDEELAGHIWPPEEGQEQTRFAVNVRDLVDDKMKEELEQMHRKKFDDITDKEISDYLWGKRFVIVENESFAAKIRRVGASILFPSAIVVYCPCCGATGRRGEPCNSCKRIIY